MTFEANTESINGVSILVARDLIITAGNQGNYNGKVLVCTVALTITLARGIMPSFRIEVRPPESGTVTVQAASDVLLNATAGGSATVSGVGAIMEVTYTTHNRFTAAVTGASGTSYTDAQALAAAKAGIPASTLISSQVSATARLTGTGYPLPANERMITLGDSRKFLEDEGANLNDPQRLTSRGCMSYALPASGHRVRYVGNYGLNTDTIEGNSLRMTQQGIATGASPTWKAQWGLFDPGLTASIAVVLVGVNNTTQPIGVTGPKYDTLFTSWLDMAPGKVLVILNELPNSNQSGQGDANYLRRVYLDTWPYSSGLTDAQKTKYAAQVLHVNSYDADANPTSPAYAAPGMYPQGELLHPGPLGAYSYGVPLGRALGGMLAAAGFPLRNGLISTDSASLLAGSQMTGTVAISATNGETAGAGGANMDGNGAACVSGTLATNWSIGRGSTLRTLLNAAQPVAGNQLSVVASKGVDEFGGLTQVITITGQLGASTANTYGLSFTNSQFFTAANIGSMNGAGNGLADGDLAAAIGRLKIGANPQGLLGASIEQQLSSTTYPNINGAIGSGNTQNVSGHMNVMPLLDQVLLSQPSLVPAGFAAAVETKTIAVSSQIRLQGGVPINIVLTFSQFGMVKNR